MRIISDNIWQLTPPRLHGRASPTDAVFHVGSPGNQSCQVDLRASEGQSVSTAMPSQGDHQVSSFLSCLFRARVDWTSLASSGFSAMTGPSDAIAENVLPACFLVVSNLINLLHILLHISDDHCYFCDPHLVDMEKMSGNGT